MGDMPSQVAHCEQVRLSRAYCDDVKYECESKKIYASDHCILSVPLSDEGRDTLGLSHLYDAIVTLHNAEILGPEKIKSGKADALVDEYLKTNSLVYLLLEVIPRREVLSYLGKKVPDYDLHLSPVYKLGKSKHSRSEVVCCLVRKNSGIKVHDLWEEACSNSTVKHRLFKRELEFPNGEKLLLMSLHAPYGKCESERRDFLFPLAAEIFIVAAEAFDRSKTTRALLAADLNVSMVEETNVHNFVERCRDDFPKVAKYLARKFKLSKAMLSNRELLEAIMPFFAGKPAKCLLTQSHGGTTMNPVVGKGRTSNQYDQIIGWGFEEGELGNVVIAEPPIVEMINGRVDWTSRTVDPPVVEDVSDSTRACGRDDTSRNIEAASNVVEVTIAEVRLEHSSEFAKLASSLVTENLNSRFKFDICEVDAETRKLWMSVAPHTDDEFDGTSEAAPSQASRVNELNVAKEFVQSLKQSPKQFVSVEPVKPDLVKPIRNKLRMTVHPLFWEVSSERDVIVAMRQLKNGFTPHV
ncbi:MAG: hypothetical protein MHM6MM_007040 [Cercozoa sp. M6MM]